MVRVMIYQRKREENKFFNQALICSENYQISHYRTYYTWGMKKRGDKAVDGLSKMEDGADDLPKKKK